MLKDFCTKLKSDSEYFEILGECPGSSKPYIHINDVCNFIIATIMNGSNINLYAPALNICGHGSISSMEAAGHLMKIVNKFKPIKFLGDGSTWQGDNRTLLINSNLSDYQFDSDNNSSEFAMKQAIKDIYGIQ